MVLSKRERYIALGTAAAVGILVLDHFVLTPLLQAQQTLEQQIDAKQKTLSENRRAIQQARANRERWREMQAGGLSRHSAAEAESEVMKEVRNWAQQAGVNLTLLKADRSEKDKVFQRSTVRVTVTGGMGSVSRFLWYVQTASIPIQFNEFQLNTHKEGTDDLSLQLALGTLFLPTDAAAAERPTTAPLTSRGS